MPSPFVARLKNLRAKLEEKHLDAILISQAENRRYLSGFTGSTGWLFISYDKALIASDFRYYEQIGTECPDFDLVKITGLFADVLPEMIKATGATRLGFEAATVTVSQLQKWRAATPGARWFATYEMVEYLRAPKDDAELAIMKEALALTDRALAHGMEHVRPGMKERELAWILESYMRTHGAEGVAFEMLVQTGPHSAMPHYSAGEGEIREGEPLLIDMGAKVRGYHADLTRTFFVGKKPGKKFREIYDVVLRAQEAAKKGIRAGMVGKDAHALAQKVIGDAGYGDKFGHGLGHGVGLAIHEKPSAGRISEDILVPGSLVTMEPGIYIPGWGGVRIEDVVRVTNDGVEVLTGSPKEPVLSI
ncbi:MAG: aminopeptidase P family protein [Anaerolineae bacterium]|nr:aminopeptidase P family protein [Anaerolineae bacterium]